MPWPIVYHEQRPAEPQVGDMWPAPEWRQRKHDGHLLISQRYLQEDADKREPWVVMLPDGLRFCLDSKPSDEDKDDWIVTGTPPNITVTPSIDAEGSYHGFIKDGVLSDDIDGRKYDSQGRPLCSPK